MTNENPRTANLNDAIDFGVDMAQDAKNTVNNLIDYLIKNGVDLGVDVKNRVNDALDHVIDAAQKAKG